VRSHAHLHLFSHVEDHESERARSGAGQDFVRIGAGIAYESSPGQAGIGYCVAAVVRTENGSLAVRIWPRRWSDRSKVFRNDVDNLPEGSTFAQHPVRFALPAAPPHAPAATPPSGTAAPPAAPSPPAVPALTASVSASITFTFPPPLLDAYRQNELAVLFGSGLSLASDVRGNFPRWNDLAERLLEQVAKLGVWSQQRIDAKRASFQGGPLPLEEMLSELDTVKTALRGPGYRAALNAIFRPRDAAPGDVHRALVGLDLSVLATTNYDPLLEHAEGSPVRAVYTWTESDKALADIQDSRKVLFKIHGTAEHEDSVVMTKAEYTQAAASVPYQRAMSYLLQSHTFLLVGYGINDPLDLDLVFELNTRAFGSAARTHYALVKDASANDRDRWLRELNVQVVPYHDHAELPGILRALRAANPRPR
jgi:hypothetical protein